MSVMCYIICTADLSLSDVLLLEHLKWQMSELQCLLITNKGLSCIGVDANIAIVLSVN